MPHATQCEWQSYLPPGGNLGFNVLQYLRTFRTGNRTTHHDHCTSRASVCASTNSVFTHGPKAHTTSPSSQWLQVWFFHCTVTGNVIVENCLSRTMGVLRYEVSAYGYSQGDEAHKSQLPFFFFFLPRQLLDSK